jgi:predicted amidohydrolase YtcJ
LNKKLKDVLCRIPLLKDNHSHPYLYAALSEAIDLRGVKTKEEALNLLLRSPHEFKIAYGWNDSQYSFTPDEFEHLPPMVIIHTSLHRFILNAAAKNRLMNSHPEILGNCCNPQWVEKNFSRVLKFIMALNCCEKELLSYYFKLLLDQGTWYIEEMSLMGSSEIEMLSESDLFDRTACWTDLETYGSLRNDHQERVRGIKLFADGSLGAKTAALDRGYLGSEEGILNYTEEELAHEIKSVLAIRKSLSIHAVGDLAISQVIHTLGKVKRTIGFIPETRIEHCQFISKEDAKRAKSLGIILSMQPNFSNESIAYSDRLSPKWRLANNPFRMLIDDVGFIPGKDILLGSDGMPPGAEAALQTSLFPPLQSQTLTIDEFIAGYCMQDQQWGWIEVGIDESKKKIKIENIQTKK